ncbi:MAG: hypothetical protein MJY94_01375 [Bacteroidales bacterium]|nr:hypothetical protein [Bacteroidales bacterium]
MKKSVYISPSVETITLKVSHMILANSVTDHPVTVSNVTVEEYTIDSSFGSNGDGIWDISF